MRLTKRQILRLIYEQQVQDSSTPAEVEPEEDVWAGGDAALEEPINHEEAEGLPSNVQKPETLDIETQKVVERIKRKLRLKRIIREQAVAAEEVVPPESVVVEPAAAAEEERASASQQSLRDWLKDTASAVAGMGIPDNQIPALLAAMDDLIMSAQSGKMASREDKVRSHIDTE